MAINASNSGVVSRGGSYTNKDFPLSVSVTERSVSTANNTSVLDLSCTLKSNTTKKAWDGANDSYLSLYWHDNVSNTNKKVGSNLVINLMGAGESKSISGSLTITHATDGTASGYAYTTWTKLGSNSAVPSTGTVRAPASGNLNLTTIARAATVSLSKTSHTISASTGNALTVSYSANSSFTYTLTATMDGNSTTLTSTTITNATLLSLLKTKSNDTLTVTLTTKNGSTTVGTSSATCSITVDTSAIKPSISAGNPVIATNAYSSKAVAGRSTLYIDVTTTAASGSPTTTTTVTISNNGTMANSSSTTVGSSARYRTNTVPSSSTDYTLTFYINAVDARGARATQVTKTIQIYGWFAPSISYAWARRTTSATSTNTDVGGAYVRLDISNTVSTNLGTTVTTSGTYSTSAGGSGSFTGTSCNFALPIDKTASITITTVDPIGVSVSRTVSVGVAKIPLHLYMNNAGSSVGVGIGSVAKNDRLCVGLQSYFTGGNLYVGGQDKVAYDDGIAGVSLHNNGNIVMVSDAYPHLGFMSNNSKEYTARIYEESSKKLAISAANGIHLTGNMFEDGYIFTGGKTQDADGKTGALINTLGGITTWAGSGAYPSLVFRRASNNTNIAYLQAREAANTLAIAAAGGVNVPTGDFNVETGEVKRHGSPCAFSDTTNVVHFKWVSGTGLEVYVDQTKVATI